MIRDYRISFIKIIGESKVIRYISRGAYAHVFEVNYKKNNRILKWLFPKIGDPDAAERFENEMAALKKLNHISIPKLIHYGKFEGRQYIIETKAPGKTLKQLREDRLQEGLGAFFGEIRILKILQKVLTAVRYMHSKGIHHRDLKDENILTNEDDSIVSIVDLGVCFGENLPHEINTFRSGVGSARFCPPSKLQLKKSDDSHDIFAVGVLGYLLLTNTYPWEVSPKSNVTELLNLMLSKVPDHLYVFNQEISIETSKFILSLIDIKDENRPTAASALKSIMKLIAASEDKLSKQEEKVVRHTIVLPKVTLDPIHKDIRYTNFEQSIINSKEFQRLRYIKQLGFANLVFYGAEHSRFSHAIGTLHVANKILSNIENRGETKFSIEEKLTVRCYALVHDITHIAYGHTIEDELNFFKRHDDNIERLYRLVFANNSQIGRILRTSDFGREILNFFQTKNFSNGNIWIREIIESSCGADVLDYVDRDSHFCGLGHKIDTALFRRLTVNHKNQDELTRHFLIKVHGGHGHRADAEFAIESVMKERYALFLKVYTHPTKIAASAMLGKAITGLLYSGSKPIPKIKNRFDWMGDVELLLMLQSSAGFVGEIGKMLLQRVLYEQVYRVQILPEPGRHLISKYDLKHAKLSKMCLFEPLERLETESKIAKNVQIDPSHVIVYCSTKPPGYQKAKLYVDNKSGGAMSRDEATDVHIDFLGKHLSLWYLYVFVHPSVDMKKRQKIKNYLNSSFSI